MILEHLGDTRTSPNTILSFVRESLRRIVVDVKHFVEMKVGIPWLQVQLDLVLAYSFQIGAIVVEYIVSAAFAFAQ